MQILNHWPEKSELCLPEKVKNALLKHLIEPFFGDETAAKAFWVECPSTIFIFNEEELKNLDNFECTVQQQVEFALANPEYTDALTDSYSISLAIFNDEGAGIYIVTNKGYEVSDFNSVNDD